ncbi:Fur family transcriptional regulator [Yinghuangia soli]|uniref:Transcriptional repressor n=1 Tax=Yinghuangia soli TaxID=2908204 RepID=A0AA41Q8V3_9ACTN|nr:Fur family transcriptional regulator [Yinghuangia soli]MCF2532332.1 transcriptional repressor [Yinghuangia soli]
MTGTSRDEIPRRLRAAGLRVTAARTTVLDLIGTMPHSDAETLARAARERLGSVSTQAVYDTLHALVRAGLARRIEPADHPARFEARTGDNHHHIVCRGCGAVEDVDCVVGAAPCLTPDDDHGYDLDEAEVTFWGRCPACRAAAGPEPGPEPGPGPGPGVSPPA